MSIQMMAGQHPPPHEAMDAHMPDANVNQQPILTPGSEDDPSGDNEDDNNTREPHFHGRRRSGDEASDDNGNNNRGGHGFRHGGPHRRGHWGSGFGARGGRHGGPHSFERGPGRHHHHHHHHHPWERLFENVGARGGHRHHHPSVDELFEHADARGGHHHRHPFEELFEHAGPRGGRGGMFGMRGGHHNHPHGHPYHGQHHRGGRGMHHSAFQPGGPLGFEFLQRFASEMGNGFQVPLADFLAEGDARNVNDTQVDFIPRADVFDTASEYVVHVSLPGAQKSDISLDYDSQECTLHLAGVTHRPEFNEELHDAMITDERCCEVGVFERSIKLTSRDRQPVNIDHEKLSAKLVDGVLIVRLPKAEAQAQGARENKTIAINEIDEEKKDGENTKNNENLADVQKGLDSMEIHSETEAGDERDEESYIPPFVSEENEDDAKDYVKVDIE